jgi:hypothetical protein
MLLARVIFDPYTRLGADLIATSLLCEPMMPLAPPLIAEYLLPRIFGHCLSDDASRTTQKEFWTFVESCSLGPGSHNIFRRVKQFTGLEERTDGESRSPGW